MTPSDITYAGTSLLGGGTPDDNSVTNIKLADNAVSNAKVATAANIDATKLVTGIVSNAEFNYLDGLTSNIQTQIDGVSAGTSAIVDETSTATSYTPTDSDNYKLKYLRHVDKIHVSEPTGSFSDGDNITFVQDSSGVLEFGFKDIRKNTFKRTTASGAITTIHYTGSGWTFLCGLCETYTPIANLFPTGNAASPTPNEADATGGWASADATVTSVQLPTPQNGSSIIKIEANENDGNDRGYLTLTLDATKTYDLSFYAWTDGSTANAHFQVKSSDLDGSQILTPITNTTTRTAYTAVINPSVSSVEFMFNVVLQNGNGDVNDILYIDNVILTEQ